MQVIAMKNRLLFVVVLCVKIYKNFKWQLFF